MLVRGTLARLAGPKATPRHLPQLACFVRHALLARNASNLLAARTLTCALSSALDARRSYATTRSATAPAATAKKAVKAKAASTTAASKGKTATGTAKKAAKKPAATKAKAKTKAKTKPKTKAKPKKKKAAAKKPAPKKRAKKVLTPEQKQKAKITELRKRALREPVPYASLSAFNMFITEQIKGKEGRATELLTQLAPKFKQITPAEREHYNRLAAEATAARRAEYKAWIHSYTPDEIRIANNARYQLRTKLKGQRKPGSARQPSKLIDDRHVKRPLSAYMLFCKERRVSVDLSGSAVTEATKVIAAEWNALSDNQKKKYEDEAAALKAQYQDKIAATS